MSSAIRLVVLSLLLIGAVSAPAAVRAATGPTGTLTVSTSRVGDAINSAGKRVFDRITHTAAMIGVPGLR